MATVPLVALRSFPYAGGSVVEGEAFVALSTQDAMLLKTIGHAVDATLEDDEDDAVETASTPTPKRRRRAKQDV